MWTDRVAEIFRGVVEKIKEPVRAPIIFIPGPGFYRERDDERRRHEIWTIPGVLNGTLPIQRSEGVEVIDFDCRDEHQKPTRRFYPGAGISDFEVK